MTHDGPMVRKSIELLDVQEVRRAATEVVSAFETDWRSDLGAAEIHHIGATALSFGHTKGDVDVNVRVREAEFRAVVHALSTRLAVAQAENWTPTFASFSDDRYRLPLGVQVTVIGSPDDFLLHLRDELNANPEFLRRYDDVKVTTAANGAEAYWQAKNRFLEALKPR